MKIIDAHFHMFPATPFGEARLKAVGHKTGFPYLQEYYKAHGFVHGVIMGNGSTDPKEHQVPEGFHYCIGLDHIGDDPAHITANLDNVEKNPNVAADLSGLLEGVKDLDSYFEEQAAYVMMLRGWMAYVEDWSRFMFGTDFPAVNLQNYADFCMRLVPERHWDAFFFDNANRIYQLGLQGTTD